MQIQTFGPIPLSLAGSSSDFLDDVSSNSDGKFLGLDFSGAFIPAGTYDDLFLFTFDISALGSEFGFDSLILR